MKFALTNNQRAAPKDFKIDAIDDNHSNGGMNILKPNIGTDKFSFGTALFLKILSVKSAYLKRLNAIQALVEPKPKELDIPTFNSAWRALLGT